MFSIAVLADTEGPQKEVSVPSRGLCFQSYTLSLRICQEVGVSVPSRGLCFQSLSAKTCAQSYSASTIAAQIHNAAYIR